MTAAHLVKTVSLCFALLLGFAALCAASGVAVEVNDDISARFIERRLEYSNAEIVRRQGMGLCSLIESTNIAELREDNELVGWRCENVNGIVTPIEDDRVTVCGNYHYDCNSTFVGENGCTKRNITTASWTGLNCSDSINRFGLHNLVTSIDLSNRGLTGSISASLSYLSGLRDLDLSSNSLTGSLHSDWMCDSLFELRDLQLDQNRLSNTIPDCIGNLTKLYTLELHDNSFTGLVPASVQNLTLLTELDLSSNSLTGEFPLGIFYMPKLTKLEAHANSLTALPNMATVDAEVGGGRYGDIPGLNYIDFSQNSITSDILRVGLWGTYLPQLITLYLHENSMTGNINGTIKDLSKLRDFRAYSNSLTGPLPSTVGEMTRLEYLLLSSNSLNSSIPHAIGQATGLQYLDLSSNSFTGTVPHNLTYNTGLVELKLNSNSFTGHLHEQGFRDLDDLEVLYLQDNSLTGPWPEFNDLVSLAYLDMSRNAFTSTLPYDLLGLNCTALREFICHSCNLTGTLPDDNGSFGNMVHMERIELTNNDLSGTIPNSITSQIILQHLYLDQNNFTGTIPANLFNLERLGYVYLSYNSLSGNIPAPPSSPTYTVNWFTPYNPISVNRLIDIRLTYNQLTGAIPTTLFSSNSALRKVDLGYNSLTGTIPTSLWNPYYLTTFYAQGNRLSGTFPSGWSNHLYFSSLDIEDNSMSGALPGMFDLVALTEFSVSDNDFTFTSFDDYLYDAGSVPNSLTTMKMANLIGASCTTAFPSKLANYPSLQTIDLSGNQFSGSLDSVVQSLTNAVDLDLSNNDLSGSISSTYFAGMTPLTSLNLGANDFTGATPWNSLKSLTSLVHLDLSDNYFTTMDDGITALTNLVSLDLSGNNLAGTLPDSELGSLPRLVTLDISDNSLSSDIATVSGLADSLSLEILDMNDYLNTGVTAPKGLATCAWIQTLMGRGTLRTLRIGGVRLSGQIPNSFMSSMTSLYEIDLHDNSLTGWIPSSGTFVTGLANMGRFYINNNDLDGDGDGRLPIELCSMPVLEIFEAFPGNTALTCYPACLTAYMSVLTNGAGIGTCSPTAEPTYAPTRNPTAAPSTVPTGQPTSQPSYIYYDGKFVQTEEYYFPNVSAHRNDSLCIGELEVRSRYVNTTFLDSLEANLTELYCVEKRSGEAELYFGLEALDQDLNIKNDLGAPYPSAGTVLDKGKVRSVVYRGKQYKMSVNNITQSWDDELTYSTSAYSDGYLEGESSLLFGTGDNSSEYLWEDALLACPLMGNAKFGDKKILPIARGDTWNYGSSAMLQKIRLTDTPVSPLDSSSATPGSVDADIANLFRTGTTQLVGAYLMVKGAVIGGRDRVSIQNARRSWAENTTSCEDSASDQYSYAYDYSADLAAMSFTTTTHENVTISHDTSSWSTVDITDMTRNQLTWWYLYHPGEAFELNLLWTPLNYTLDRTYGSTHYYYEARGDPIGDTDRTDNTTTGRTEWYTSESGDPPILLMYFQ